MANDFGTQNNFEGFSRSVDKLTDGIEIFGTSIGQFVSGAFAIQQTFGSKILRTLVDKGIKIIGFAGFISAIEDLINVAYNMRKDLGRVLGMSAQNQDRIMPDIDKLTLEAGLAGITPEQIQESINEIARQFGNTMQENNIEIANTVANISRAFNVSIESATKLTSSMMKFSNLTADEAYDAINDVYGIAQAMNVPMNQVGEILAENVDNMWKLNLNSQSARQEFTKMSVESAKLGYNLANVIRETDKFRDFGQAMEASAMAGRFGLAIDPRQLMAAGMTGQVGGLTEALFNRIDEIGLTEDGMLNNIGVGLIDSFGATIGLSREEVAEALSRRDGEQPILKVLTDIREENKRNAKIQETFMGYINLILGSAILPLIQGLFGPLESMKKNIEPLTNTLTNVGQMLGKEFMALREPLLKAAYSIIDIFNEMVPYITKAAEIILKAIPPIANALDFLAPWAGKVLALLTIIAAGKFLGGMFAKFGKLLGGPIKMAGNLGGSMIMGSSKLQNVLLKGMDKGGLVGKVSTGIVESLTKGKGVQAATAAAATGGGGLLAKLGGSTLAKLGGKGMAKSVLKKIPFLGAGVGAAFAIDRAMKGDFFGAGGELLSGVASIFPGVGTMVSVATDAALIARDANKAMKENVVKPNQVDNISSSLDNLALTHKGRMLEDKERPIEIVARFDMDGRKVGQQIIRAVGNA